MSNNHFILFLKKVWHWICKYPVLVSICFIAPITISTLNYFFSGEYFFENLYFEGNFFKADAETFQLKSIKRLKRIMDISSYGNYQGGTCYHNYYLVCSNNFECILIYDLDTMNVAHTIYTGQTNTKYHCNTLFFGTTYYSAEDKFPLLYISMENINQTIAFRIYQKAGVYCIEQVQKIILKFNDNNRLYYPNSYYDYDYNLLFYSGYTKNSYMRSSDSQLVYYSFAMPDYRRSEVVIDVESSYFDTFSLPSETATQGGFISDGYLYQTFSFNKKNDPDRAPKMRVVDTRKGVLVKDYQDIGALGYYEEYENVAVSDKNRLIAFGTTTNTLYEFEYESNYVEPNLDW